eukprot:CAMPEP_0203895338 /NCGR_PEP_ID=MMETSP0359-20131031/38197_1 /ASSEMBLY_ACC=CAM_ASM_000338 /TAXON_ID=268821 /ORGANISM="Scrippsiella Hangoei, Strain SHTV-5" /LENGTH=184 /DNA_ID=CAMNT_0050817793 /DNA_START=72 /DNA_END=627 /DNA_ORIENTATION=-
MREKNLVAAGPSSASARPTIHARARSWQQKCGDPQADVGRQRRAAEAHRMAHHACSRRRRLGQCRLRGLLPGLPALHAEAPLQHQERPLRFEVFVLSRLDAVRPHVPPLRLLRPEAANCAAAELKPKVASPRARQTCVGQSTALDAASAQVSALGAASSRGATPAAASFPEHANNFGPTEAEQP